MTPMRIAHLKAEAKKNFGGMPAAHTISPREMLELCDLALGQPVPDDEKLTEINLHILGEEGMEPTPELTQKIESFVRGMSNPLRYVRPVRYDFKGGNLRVDILVDKTKPSP